MNRSPLMLMLLLALGCPTQSVPPPVIPDDDDDTGDDDDDSGDDDDTAVGDDDDSAVGDDDDSAAPGLLEIEADVPTGGLLFVQDGAGEWTPVTLTALSATVPIADPGGQYGVLLACAGADRSTVRAHFSDLAAEPGVVLACPEAVERGLPAGALTGSVLNVEGQPWSMHIGTAGWPNLPGSLSAYAAYPAADYYDLVAHRRWEPEGSVQVQVLYRALDGAVDPEQSIDFGDFASGNPHTPEPYSLVITPESADTVSFGTFLTHGGTTVPMAGRTGEAPQWEVIADERRWEDDLFVTLSETEHSDCTTASVALVDHELSLTLQPAGRHAETFVPVPQYAASDCALVASPTVTPGDTLSVDWSEALGAGAPGDALRVQIEDPTRAQRWILSGSAARPTVALDAAAVAAAVGAGYGSPTAGWSFLASAWDLPSMYVGASELFVLVDTRGFRELPSGRSRFRVIGNGFVGSRNHEYDEDDATREVIILPWNRDEFVVHGIERTGSL